MTTYSKRDATPEEVCGWNYLRGWANGAHNAWMVAERIKNYTRVSVEERYVAEGEPDPTITFLLHNIDRLAEQLEQMYKGGYGRMDGWLADHPDVTSASLSPPVREVSAEEWENLSDMDGVRAAIEEEENE